MAIKLKRNLPSILMLLFGVAIILMIPSQVSAMKVTTLGPRFIPYLVAILITVLSFLTLLDGLLGKNLGEDEGNTEKSRANASYFRVVLTFISLALWIILVPVLGFMIATTALIASVIAIIGEFKIYQIIVIPVAVTLIVYYIFNNVLNVVLPEGIFY